MPHHPNDPTPTPHDPNWDQPEGPDDVIDLGPPGDAGEADSGDVPFADAVESGSVSGVLRRRPGADDDIPFAEPVLEEPLQAEPDDTPHAEPVLEAEPARRPAQPPTMSYQFDPEPLPAEPLSPDELLAEAGDEHIDFDRVVSGAGDSSDALGTLPSATHLADLDWEDDRLPPPPAATPTPGPRGKADSGPRPRSSADDPDLADLAESLARPVRRADSSDVFTGGGRRDDTGDLDPGDAIDLLGGDEGGSSLNLSDATGLPENPVDDPTLNETAISAVRRPGGGRDSYHDDDESAIPTGDKVTVADLSDALSAAPAAAGGRDSQRRRAAALVAAGGRRRGSFWGVLGGFVLGVVATAGGGFAAWYGGYNPFSLGDPLRSMPAQPGAAEKADLATRKIEEAKERLAAADPAGARKVLGDAPITPEVQALKGWSIWLEHCRDCARANKKVQERDQPVTSARNELKGAKTAEAAFWLGVIEEELSHTSKAREIYSNALKEFPDQQKLFQAALDRLSVQEQPEARPRVGLAVPSADVLLALTLLLAPPELGPGDSKVEEAGYDFWEAVKLAQNHEYKEALERLKKAEEHHKRRRQELPGRGLNPASDPREEVFVRCCEELKAYWELRAKLKAAGEDVPPRGTVEPIVAKLLTERGGDPKALQAARDEALKATADARKALAAAKTAEANLAKAESDLKALDDYKKRLQDKSAEIDAVKVEVEKERTKADAAVKALTAEKLEVAQRLAKVSEALKAAKVDAADPVQGVEKLLADRGAAAAVLDKAALVLKDARRLPADAPASAVPDAVGKLLADLKSPADDRVKELSAKLETAEKESVRLEAARKEATAKLEAMKKESADDRIKELSTKLETVEKESAARLDAAQKGAAAKLDAMQKDSARALDSAQKNLTAKVDAVQKEAEAKLEAQQKEAATKLDALQKEAAKLQTEQKEVAAKLEAAKDAAAKSEAQEKESAAKLEAQQKEAAAKLDALRKDLGTKLADQQAEADRLAKQLASIRALPGPGPGPVPTAPESLDRPDPVASERHYSAGVAAYFGNQLGEAEQELTEAVRLNGRDARYRYFLGLVRLRQGQSAAAGQDFRRAADLERQSLPSPKLVNDSLERIQGTDRAALSQYRPGPRPAERRLTPPLRRLTPGAGALVNRAAFESADGPHGPPPRPEPGRR
jgi:hypothetical protein